MNYPPRLNPFRGTSFAWVFPFAWQLLKNAAIAVPITIEVFLHRRFGARTGISLVKGFVLVVVVYSMIDRERSPVFPLFPGFIFAYGVAAIGQWLSSRIQPENAHSHSTGEPWELWQQLPFSRHTIQRYFEPVLCGIFSGIVALFDPALALWIFLASIALFIKEQVFRARLRTRQLDAFDNRAETNDYAPRTRPEAETFVEARPAPPRQRRPRP